jgi:hypothetical protein
MPQGRRSKKVNVRKRRKKRAVCRKKKEILAAISRRMWPISGYFH